MYKMTLSLGALDSKDAQNVLPNIVNKIKEWDGDIFYTMDSHGHNYSETYEGRHLPIHHYIITIIGEDLTEKELAVIEGEIVDAK